MNSFELMPTEENLIDALKQDFLGRNEDLAAFYMLLQNIDYASAISIDGPWGSGKTFFVKQMKLIIDALNPVIEMDEVKRKEILERVPVSNKVDKNTYYVAVYYDAWENDNDSDPIMSLVYQICKELGLKYSLKGKKDLFLIASGILELLTGRDFVECSQVLSSNDPIEEIKKEKDLHKHICDFFSEVLIDRGSKLIVFIDELDRCKPSFSVRLLERIKHYMMDNQIRFVFSINSAELQHTVNHYYGDSFDSCRYLERFFDFQIELPPADSTNFYRYIGLDNYNIVESVCRKVIETYNIQLREIARYYRIVKSALYSTYNKDSFPFSDGKANRVVLMYIVPIMIGLRMTDRKKYDAFISGKDVSPLMEIYGNCDLGKTVSDILLNEEESLDERDGKKVVTVKYKLEELYNAVFVNSYEGMNISCCIGKLEFNKHSKDLALKGASLLSPYANYEI